MLLITISFGVLMALQESKNFVFIITMQMLIMVWLTKTTYSCIDTHNNMQNWSMDESIKQLSSMDLISAL